MKYSINSLCFGSAQSNSKTFDIAYLFFRFYCGISIAFGAGLAKVFHKIDEKGGEEWGNLAFGIPDWFVKQVGEIGFTFISPSFWAGLAVYGEFIGGLLIAFGLLTRFSALQMAFQFFVVSFIWFDEPMPFTMYYQQWIFWSFVLIAAMGGGRFSLDHWFLNKRLQNHLPKKAVVAGLFLTLAGSAFGQSQTNAENVSFTVSNPGMKMLEIDLRYFDDQAFTSRGYGYELGALRSHAVNMPVGTRVYQRSQGKQKLLFVIRANDQGRRFDLRKKYEISPEQWLKVAKDEQNQELLRLKKNRENTDLATIASSNGYKMVTFRVAGKTTLGRPVIVRAQLPFDVEKTNLGFSQRLSRSTELELSYPIGTKIYLCDGNYWSAPVNETYLFTVDSEKQNDLIRI